MSITKYFISLLITKWFCCVDFAVAVAGFIGGAGADAGVADVQSAAIADYASFG